MYYQANKERSKTINTEPSLADQAGARDTDINIIVGRFLKTGMATAPNGQPITGDFTQLPRDLRGFIETASKLNQHRHQLPPQLKDMDLAELLALTPDQLTTILTPPAPKQDDKVDDTK